MKTKLGIYGGTFAPVHNGHINAALEFKRQFKLDRLLIIPTYIPPHKALPLGDSPKDRLNMLHLAFDDETYRKLGIEISDYELNKGGKSYTVDTLKHFDSETADLYMLCGTDMLLTIDSWKDPISIAQLATLVFVRREQPDSSINKKIEDKIEYLKTAMNFRIQELVMSPIEISSSYIRANITSDLTGLIPEKVEQYIKTHNLYRE